jgi:hypothetical protein
MLNGKSVARCVHLHVVKQGRPCICRRTLCMHSLNCLYKDTHTYTRRHTRTHTRTRKSTHTFTHRGATVTIVRPDQLTQVVCLGLAKTTLNLHNLIYI